VGGGLSSATTTFSSTDTNLSAAELSTHTTTPAKMSNHTVLKETTKHKSKKA
jgi:hypothetical protein